MPAYVLEKTAPPKFTDRMCPPGHMSTTKCGENPAACSGKPSAFVHALRFRGWNFYEMFFALMKTAAACHVSGRDFREKKNSFQHRFARTLTLEHIARFLRAVVAQYCAPFTINYERNIFHGSSTFPLFIFSCQANLRNHSQSVFICHCSKIFPRENSLDFFFLTRLRKLKSTELYIYMIYNSFTSWWSFFSMDHIPDYRIPQRVLHLLLSLDINLQISKYADFSRLPFSLWLVNLLN